jgi:hypothetical protein
MDQPGSTADNTTSSNDPIEELLRTLHGQIKTSEWLNENTNKLESENPELIKAWKEAVNSKTSNEQN